MVILGVDLCFIRLRLKNYKVNFFFFSLLPCMHAGWQALQPRLNV